jgi:Glu-tRNA(Gln) amidotransferase subunit E-like FAD-binding protein
LDFTTLKSIQTVYPKYIKQYKDILLDPNSDVETKVDTIVQSLNRVSANEQQLVNNWNQVMQWAMNDGLDAAVSTQIAALEASGYFDSLLTSLFNSELGTETLATTSQDIKGAINEVKGVADSNTSALADRADIEYTAREFHIENIKYMWIFTARGLFYMSACL